MVLINPGLTLFIYIYNMMMLSNKLPEDLDHPPKQWTTGYCFVTLNQPFSGCQGDVRSPAEFFHPRDDLSYLPTLPGKSQASER